MNRPTKEPVSRNHLDENHYRNPDVFKSAMSTKQLRETLLATGGWVLAAGYRYDVKSERLGAGVLSVWLEKSP